jgi:hypothetical protein
MSNEIVSDQDLCYSDRLVGGLFSAFRRAGVACKDVVNISIPQWRRNRDQASLESALARIIETANGHQASGVAKGSPVYIELNKKADERIGAFCEKWTVARSVVDAEAPNLVALRSLCVAGTKIPPGLKLVACVVGTVLSLALLGMASGIIQGGHDLVIHFIHH